MDPSSSGLVLDPSKHWKLGMNEKRELVHELSKCSESAIDILQSWSRKDLLEVLCAEMGKERKYTGLTKQKLIELLLKIVSEKKSVKNLEEKDSTSHPPPSNPPSSKRQRKADCPSRLPIETNIIIPSNNGSEIAYSSIYCENLACKATLSIVDVFCKRCSCCICYRYDDNKDPSLWLVCSSESSLQGDSCGLSCHLECALKNEKAGISKGRNGARLDGSFYCTSCGKMNDLLGCLRKQLVIAKDARRVDVLCHRISLSHKLLDGTEKYKKLHSLIDMVIKNLEAEVGPLNGLLSGMARGLVNRLSSGTEIQKLCIIAIDALDNMLSPASQSSSESDSQKTVPASSPLIKIEDISPTSVTVLVGSDDGTLFSEEITGYGLWHRISDFTNYQTEPTCKLVKPARKFLVSELIPATKYVFKVVALSAERKLEKWEAEVTTGSYLEYSPKSEAVEGELTATTSPKTNSSDLSIPSEGDESNNAVVYGDLNELPEDHDNYHDKPEIPDLEKSADCKETSHLRGMCIGTIASRTETTAPETTVPEETPGHSVSALDEEPNSTIQTTYNKDPADLAEQNQTLDMYKCENGSSSPAENATKVIPYRKLEYVLPVTPSKLEASKEGALRSGKAKSGSNGLENWFLKPAKEIQLGSSSKKKSAGKGEETCNRDGSIEGDYEYCVKVIRWLECKGHIETSFRVQFLTWFSLRATPQERRVVSVFVDTLIDDPASLAGQLVDTFSEGVSSKRPPLVPTGFCMRLWH